MDDSGVRTAPAAGTHPGPPHPPGRGWWPRSTDPVAELPGLVLAIDHLHGPISRLILTAGGGWSNQPHRLGVAGRVLRLGYFTSQPANLLTAICADGARVDLLVVPPDTAESVAETAMTVAASADNVVPAQLILAAAEGQSR